MTWKKQALGAIPDSFSARRARDAQNDEVLKAQLYQQIGQLKVELDWLKKNWIIRLREDVSWSSRRICTSVCGDNASCWD